MDADRIINDYTSDKPESFGGAFRFNNTKDKDKVLKTLSKNDTFTKFKQYKKPRRYSPVFVREKRELFESDSVYMSSFPPEENDGYKFIFITIDTFTKKVWCYPLRNLTCAAAVSCMNDIFSKCGQLPKRLHTDRGREFDCKQMKDFLQSKGVHHYFSYSDRKCPYVERVNLTIQNLIKKITHSNMTNRWIDVLDQAQQIYHSRKHRAIGMSPDEAERDENQNKVLLMHQKKWFNVNKILEREKPSFKVGDTVRIFLIRSRFIRGYDQNFTSEYFNIHSVNTKLPSVRYILKDYEGELIKGSFFQNELIHYNPEGAKFPVEKIGKPKYNRKTKKTEQYVRFIGWPQKYNSWLPIEDLT